MTINNLQNIYQWFTNSISDYSTFNTIKNFHKNRISHFFTELENSFYNIIPSYNKSFTVFTLNEVNNVLEVAYSINSFHLEKITYAIRYVRKSYYSNAWNTILMTCYFYNHFHDKFYILVSI